MKKIVYLSLLLAGFFFVLTACGEKEAKPEQPKTVQPAKPADKPAKPAYDKMNDTAFANVMAVLREALDNEKKQDDSLTRLNTAKAYILVIKFIRTDKDKVKKSGMTDSDISMLVDDARTKATSRLKDIIASPTAPKELKDQAQDKLKELDTL